MHIITFVMIVLLGVFVPGTAIAFAILLGVDHYMTKNP